MAIFSVHNSIDNKDEVNLYQLERYVSTNEAFWRIFNFPIHERYPTVVHLSVHLENRQRVYFMAENAVGQIQAERNSTLMAFFKLCSEDDFAQGLFDHEVPSYYTWDAGNRTWKRRKIGRAIADNPNIKRSDAIGRVYTVHPRNEECFCLRMLLHEIRGPTSFIYLRTVGNRIYNSYKDACHVRGMLEDDEQWRQTLIEAVATRTIRELFAVMLQFCGMSNPVELWEEFKDSMSEDCLRREETDIYNKTLADIEDRIKHMGGEGIHKWHLPRPQRNFENIQMIPERTDNTEAYINETEYKLITEQRLAYTTIINDVEGNKGGMFFLDAAGGTGKTFLLNLILAKIRRSGMHAIAVASSGIAATLLLGGRTAHSAFKLPLDVQSSETPLCNVTRGGQEAIALRECRLIIWDECTMSHKKTIQAVDTLMKDLCGSEQVMGGVTVVFAGDFRQTLPVIPRGTRADELQACLKSSYIWTMHLETNMHAYLANSDSNSFVKALLTIGDGKTFHGDSNGLVTITHIGRKVSSTEELKEKVFCNLIANYKYPEWLSERAILAPKNEEVNSINRQLISIIPGESINYKSVDTTSDTNEAGNYPVEFLHSLDPPGLPPHSLELKVGVPIMLIRNLNQPKLCNGTRLIVKVLHPHLIQASVLTGNMAGQELFLPRIPLIASNLPFSFRRLQFPVKTCFAMTINKSQGQTLKVVGLHLLPPCFSHGQLYVGCSRVGDKDNLYIYSEQETTANVVYREAL